MKRMSLLQRESLTAAHLEIYLKCIMVGIPDDGRLTCIEATTDDRMVRNRRP